MSSSPVDGVHSRRASTCSCRQSATTLRRHDYAVVSVTSKHQLHMKPLGDRGNLGSLAMARRDGLAHL